MFTDKVAGVVDGNTTKIMRGGRAEKVPLDCPPKKSFDFYTTLWY
jgi:hypothetical protein